MNKPLKPASRLKRLAALIYDSFLVVAILFLATFIALLFRHGKPFEPYHLGYMIYLLVVAGTYLTWCWTKSGQTLGMLAWRIKLVNQDEQLISWPQSFCRYLFSCLGFWLGGIGIVWMFVNRKGLSLADKFSQTKMVSLPKPN